MQGINATLIVQAINFGIAYLILRKFVFAPGIALVLKERAHEARLQTEVMQATEQIHSEQERLTAEWAAEQKKLATQIPALPEELFVLRHIKPEILLEELPSERDMIESKKALVKALVYSVEAKR